MRTSLTLLATALLALTACVRVQVHGDPAALAADTPVRIATYNTSLYDDADQGLIRRLEAGDDGARKIAAVLQRVRPDVVLLNEFDYDADGRAAELFQRRYLDVPQHGGEPLRYAYRYYAPVNTGVPSGLDLDRDGRVGGEGRARGNDAWGYGLHPGQYGMLLLSRYPIDAAQVRSFQQFKWSALPGARVPRAPSKQDPASGAAWYPPAVWSQLRLSSKSHWDVPVRTPLGVVHMLVSHPTPPVFDGPEDRNGARNHDEIRLWAEYLSAGERPWLCDDAGRCGGLAADAAFVILGDMNADPVDGDGAPGAIAQLLQHPRVNDAPAPRSAGAPQRAADYGLPRRGDTATHTGDFGPKAGTLRLDYVLPSRNLRLRDSGVFWPARESADAAIADGSDHHLVWVDLGGG
ncbi:endonuclease/exonuclease/phosphatase family protein [Lysobacter silvisoli]|uniref:Endonuclease/exonuclease/phosphatase family protein n=1 Tax=Lysobacter silvisoli TaxID=2293254 RepID=A0A371K1L6_9GAMM|nr:endonuclease/exonuclease/phosphatase family protein [Lysobacter silvisoli]RDZ27821.1 endonuclease/exonuclease/phosphatase family protein [Lysobacter silvisoli]